MRNTPWIILLCKFSDDPRTATLRPIADYADFFGSDHPESIPSYWRDVSYEELDLVTGTEVSPWLQLPQKRSDYKGLETQRPLFEWARAATKAGHPSKAFGAVTGKLPRPLKERRGSIPVLIALQ